MHPLNLYSQLVCLGFNPREMFLDQGKHNIVVYFNISGYIKVAEVLFSLNCDKRGPVLVKAHICDCDKENQYFDFAAQRSCGGIAAQSYRNYAFKPNDFVLVLSDLKDIAVLRVLREQGISHMALTPFITQAKEYTMFVKPLLALQREQGVAVITIKRGCFISSLKRGLTRHETMMREKKYTFTDIYEKRVSVTCFNGFDYDTPKGIEELLRIQKCHYDNDGSLVLNDCVGEFVNCENGRRRTCYSIDKPKRNIFILGSCVMQGYGAQDSGTIASFLQKRLNDCAEEQAINVHNYAVFLESRYMNYAAKLSSLPIEYGDIIVIQHLENAAMSLDLYPDFEHLAFEDNIFEGAHGYGEVFIDDNHLTENGMRAYADRLYDMIESNNFFQKEQPPFSKVLRDEAKDLPFLPQLTEWLEEIRPLRKNVGSIVMNCNPFTLGHRYLIEYAAEHCLHLYIFVVEEDKSVFPFRDRFELIRKGVSDLTNVTVLPSGQFIISQLTFTDYFGKSELQDKVIDPTFDVALFAEHIAPALGITMRFAGEEPLDKVTLQYNQAMARILPKYGIDFEVIPRKESDGAVISASRVRALLKDNNFAEIKKIVPETTHSYLLEKYGNQQTCQQD